MKIRYIRESMNGSNANTGCHWCEIQAIDYLNKNIALNKNVTYEGGPYEQGSPSVITNGNINYTDYIYFRNDPQKTVSVTIDLNGVYDIDIIKVWHYHNGGRIYKNILLEVSSDGNQWTTIFNSNSDGEYAETSEGKSHKLMKDIVLEELSDDASLSEIKTFYENYLKKIKHDKEILKNILQSKNIACDGNEKMDELIYKITQIKSVIPEWYDSDAWIFAADMPTNRKSLTSSAVDNKIYCIGGYTSTYINTNECYDTTTNKWITKASLPTSRYGLVSSVVDNKIYCIAGSDAYSADENECYDPATNSWSTKTKVPVGTSSFSSSSVVYNKIYCMGGTYNRCYDPSTNTWSTKTNIPSTKYGSTTSTVDNKIYCIGGYSGSSLSTSIYCYDPSTNTWSSKTTKTVGKSLTSAEVNGKIYTMGGINSSANTIFDYNNCYDPATDSWSTKRSLPTSRYELTSSVVDNKIYVIGGRNSTTNYRKNECYIP